MDKTDQDSAVRFDAFKTLGLERKLALENEIIDTTWRMISRELHPDTDAGDAERAMIANRAHQLLRSPTQRLRHWLELEGAELKRQTSINPELMNLFTEVGSILAEADEVLKRRAAASSAIAKALLAEKEVVAQQKIQGLLGKLQGERNAVIERFVEFEDSAANEKNYSAALAANGTLGFLEKWEHQVQHRLMDLIAG